MRVAIAVLLLLSLCACRPSTPAPSPTPAPETTLGIANPASENCIRQGGTLSIQKRGDGGEYGVCVFSEGMECEEWALFRGECPVGGVPVANASTPAARYCMITGGTYTVTGNAGAENEEGTCAFPNGRVCDVWDYFNGKCDPNS